MNYNTLVENVCIIHCLCIYIYASCTCMDPEMSGKSSGTTRVVLNAMPFTPHKKNTRISHNVNQKSQRACPDRKDGSPRGICCSISLSLYSLHVLKFPVFSSQPSGPLPLMFWEFVHDFNNIVYVTNS